ncbi:MAG: class IV adenylate cyclase [Desulfobacterales bacterium]|nr:class IV adenylate cyclase [Desulfobacterales bacterium]
MTNTDLEIEVKFYLAAPEESRRRIEDLGAEFAGKRFEQNIRFEDADASLIRKNALLRLRRTDSRAELTYKGEAPEENRDFKVHRELEVTVSDFDTAAAIFEALGYHNAQVYEKHRETYIYGNTILCMDRMPFGFFLEIEGQPDAIRQTAQELGLDWNQRILANYLAIFDRLKSECALGFNDVTFDHFAGVNLDFGRFVQLFAAGG